MESQFGQCWKQKCLIKVKIKLPSIISSSKKSLTLYLHDDEDFWKVLKH